jgi:hypothetical protein
MESGLTMRLHSMNASVLWEITQIEKTSSIRQLVAAVDSASSEILEPLFPRCRYRYVWEATSREDFDSAVTSMTEKFTFHR